MSAEHNMKRSLEVRGYAVVATLRLMKEENLISVVNRWDEENEFNHPWGIVAETNREDYEEQCRLAGDITYLDPDYQYFYRVRTD